MPSQASDVETKTLTTAIRSKDDRLHQNRKGEKLAVEFNLKIKKNRYSRRKTYSWKACLSCHWPAPNNRALSSKKVRVIPRHRLQCINYSSIVLFLLCIGSFTSVFIFSQRITSLETVNSDLISRISSLEDLRLKDQTMVNDLTEEVSQNIKLVFIGFVMCHFM